MKMVYTDRRFRKIRRVIAGWILGFLVCLPAAGASGLVIDGVRLNQAVLTPGNEVSWSFSLSLEARVTVQVFTPDYDIVRHLITDQARTAGINTVVWDGRDDAGIQVPNEAYLVGIAARGPDGERAIYDPTANSGGEIADIRIEEISRPGDLVNIGYSVLRPSRITMKAGIRNGPLLKTLLESAPMPAGTHLHVWDGLDGAGRIRIMDMTGAHLYMEGFVLPDNSVIVQNSEDNYREYRSTLNRADQGILTYLDARKSLMARMGQGISPQALVRQSLSMSPFFTVYLENDATGLAEKPVSAVSGEIKLTIAVAPESMYIFNETRHEIIIFVDNRRFDEEEHAHTPYTYILDTRKLTNGRHFITINQASLSGQVGAYSFYLDVENKQ
jgi:hypothetical protein